jgi:LuxR family transcriptional regulator, maltose regulon positive regulatory protein
MTSRDVIPAKLERPRIRGAFVERLRLTALLDASLDGRLTLLSAPPGYGKSTLVAQWLGRPSAPPSAWLSVDRLDSDPERFAMYLTAALRQVARDCLPRTCSLLESGDPGEPEHLAESMAGELEETEDTIVLVLDDYEAIEGEAVHELVTWLVPRLPHSLHLVILTRIDPPLPGALWQSRHWLTELRASDLQFTPEETRAFFAAADGPSLGDQALEVVHRKTEGWAAGLRLAQLSLASSEDPEQRVRALSGSDRLIVDYLMDEVLAAQPPDVREFLGLTAPLERFSAALCDELLADRSSPVDSQQVIDRLYHDNVFLFPLGPDRGWYRYHHLFRELLLEHLDRLAPGVSQSEISDRAGAWLARQHSPGAPAGGTVSEKPAAGAGSVLRPWEVLTNRELDVLELLQARLTNKEIAARLFVSPETVKKHTFGIYRKLGVSGRRQAVAVALDRRILQGPSLLTATRGSSMYPVSHPLR